jgi:hypothetical protein
MEEKPVDTANRAGLIFPGVLSLAVGVMFFVPGIYFTKIILSRLMRNQLPDGLFVAFTVFIGVIGLILLLLAYQFFTGKVGRQHISTPILIFASAFFITLSTAIALATYVFKCMPTGYQPGRGIGGGFAIGCFGLWFAYKRSREASNQEYTPDQKTAR